MKRLVFVLLLVMTAAAQAQYFPDPDYERVLVPVFFFGGGAGGAQWWSNVDLLNTGPQFDLAHDVLVGEPACEQFCGCDEKSTVESYKAETLCPRFENDAGLLLYVPRNVDRDQLHAYSRVFDQSRVSERAGTMIPVVWERDLLPHEMVLLDVRISGGYRATVRLFDAFQWPTLFTLRFYDMAKLRDGVRQLLLETHITAQYSPVGEPDPSHPLSPAFAVIGNVRLQYPQLANVESVAIEILGSDPLISPPPPGLRFYALASITNDATQEVTIVAPR
ncbi:MAG: hypothetical protein ACLGH0_13235 [Thermoanaerobaculia bacterium]